MNIRAVLRTYGMLRSLTDDESALLETLRKFTDTEREAFVEALGPQKSKKPTRQRSSKSAGKSIPLCAACGYAESSIVHKQEDLSDYHPFQPPLKKSARAASLASAIKPALDGSVSKMRCAAVIEGGEVCGMNADNNIHHLTTHSYYHEFQPAQQSAVAGD